MGKETGFDQSRRGLDVHCTNLEMIPEASFNGFEVGLRSRGRRRVKVKLGKPARHVSNAASPDWLARSRDQILTHPAQHRAKCLPLRSLPGRLGACR